MDGSQAYVEERRLNQVSFSVDDSLSYNFMGLWDIVSTDNFRSEGGLDLKMLDDALETLVQEVCRQYRLDG